MDDKRDRLSELFDRAVALPADAREKLFDACCDDPALQSELRSLLSAYDRAPNFLEALGVANGFGSAAIITAKVTLKDDGLPMIDQMYGHYRVEALVGTGGMGRVYRARDTKLHRLVAIKILRSTLGQASRLMKEARAAAALNHPHICTIHEVGEAGDQAFIVMECSKGSH